METIVEKLSPSKIEYFNKIALVEKLSLSAL
jgi:hypothetical protein